MLNRVFVVGVWIALSVVESGAGPAAFVATHRVSHRCRRSWLKESNTLESVKLSLEQTFEKCKNEIAKNCKITVGPSKVSRLGLVAAQKVKKGDVFLSIPYDDAFVLTPNLARKTVLKRVLPEAYDGWTGDAGLIALLILNEVARADKKGIDLPKRSASIQAFMEAWVASLPSLEEMASIHPLMWSEGDQEVLQYSSTRKIYQALDDIDEDAAWLSEKVWSNDRASFPESVTWNGQTIPCFDARGFKWAVALANSRSVFVDGSLRLMPLADICNHDDGAREIEPGYMGTFGTTKGAQLVATRDYSPGEEVFCSYGPKSAAEYVLDHGFCPPQAQKVAVSELTFEIDSEDRFYDDKLDVLEFETYEQMPMDPSQSFDVLSSPDHDGEPDAAMIQFLRLCKLGGGDAFLLESVFRSDVWYFMSLPVSEQNELDVVNTILDACRKALDEMKQSPEDGPELCAQLRGLETEALSKTVEYLKREREALDLKEYYQERRLKDLGLDSEWNPEDDDDDVLGYGQTRRPGVDLDW